MDGSKLLLVVVQGEEDSLELLLRKMSRVTQDWSKVA